MSGLFDGRVKAVHQTILTHLGLPTGVLDFKYLSTPGAAESDEGRG